MTSITPLAETVHRLTNAAWALLAEHDAERDQARWPRATRDMAAIHTGRPADPTHRTAANPDPVNTARAEELERLLRRIYHDLEDAVTRARRNRVRSRSKPCTQQGCDQTAIALGLCRTHYQRTYRANR